MTKCCHSLHALSPAPLRRFRRSNKPDRGSASNCHGDCKPRLTWTNGRHLGRFGLRMRCMPASFGVRLALRVLHVMQEHTIFSQVVGPPRSRGHNVIQIQILAFKYLAAILAGIRSRSKILCRVNLTSFLGSRSKNTSKITLGTRILKEMVWMLSGCGSCWEKSCHWVKLKVWKEPSCSSRRHGRVPQRGGSEPDGRCRCSPLAKDDSTPARVDLSANSYRIDLAKTSTKPATMSTTGLTLLGSGDSVGFQPFTACICRTGA